MQLAIALLSLNEPQTLIKINLA